MPTIRDYTRSHLLVDKVGVDVDTIFDIGLYNVDTNTPFNELPMRLNIVREHPPSKRKWAILSSMSSSSEAARSTDVNGITWGTWSNIDVAYGGGLVWNATSHYIKGTTATFNNTLYIALQANTGSNPENNPADWVSVLDQTASQIEIGGLDWDAGKQYSAGTTTTRNGVIYLALTANLSSDPLTNPSDWKSVVDIIQDLSNIGGLKWSASTNYKVGTTATANSKPYVALTDNINSDPVNNPSDWISVADIVNADIDIGGLAWNAATEYKVGMTATESGVIYVAAVATTNSLPSTNPSDWYSLQELVIATTQIGGILWSSSVDYKVGTTVTYNDALYIATSDNTNSDPTTGTDWKSITDLLAIEPERGGVIWTSTKNYKVGDIVTTSSDDILYRAINDNINSDPLVGTDWIAVTSIRHDAGVFTPESGDEYPDTSAETAGAVWYTTGVADEGYTLTEGTLIGKNFRNNDKYVWFGGDNWLYEPFPRVAGEVGGLIYQDNVTYTAGTLVTEGSDIYRASVDIAENAGLPSTNPDWVILSYHEVGGLIWDASLTYAIGTIIAYDEALYIATAVNTNEQPDTSSSWERQHTSIEQGGVAYNDAVAYNAGAIVTYNNHPYVATINIAAGQGTPDTNSDWLEYTIVEKGGLIWDPAIDYKVGTIVSRHTYIYQALADTIGEDPETKPSKWLLLSEGGEGWSSNRPYKKGLVVSEGDTLYIAKEDIEAGGTIPSASSKWLKYISGSERGGVAWDNTVNYEVNDLVVKNSTIYLALQASTDKDPETEAAYWRAVDTTESVVGKSWNNTPSYVVGDIVSHQEDIYIAKQDNTNVDPSTDDTVWGLP